MSKIASITFATGYFFVVFLAGVFSSQIAFRDPDTCWILALGKWIVEQKQLPITDPFSSNLYSYVTIGKDYPLIQYQWIIEILFYWAWQIGEAVALLLLVSLSIGAAFVLIPFLLLGAAEIGVAELAILCFGLYSSSLRFIARPEIYSSLFLGIVLLLERNYVQFDARKKLFASIGIMLIMCLWSNCHMLFPLGVVVLAATSASRVIHCIRLKGSKQELFLHVLPLVLGWVGTLANPWGIHLWIYEYRLTVSPVSFANADHAAPVWTQPYSIAHLFTLLLAAFLIWRAKGLSITKMFSRSWILWLIATAASLKYAKLLPEAFLLVCAAVSIAGIVKARNNVVCSKTDLTDASFKQVAESSAFQSFIDRCLLECERLNKSVNKSLNGILSKRIQFSSIILILLVLSGSILGLKSFGVPALPGNTQFVHIPDRGLEFLNKNQNPEGRLFNEGVYGSVMTWRLKKCPDLFMDTRFSQFEPELVADYEHMMLCEGDWKSLFRKYKIDWAFVPAWTPISKTLSNDPSWQKYYQDGESVILKRLN